jgi:hypothetical protein
MHHKLPLLSFAFILFFNIKHAKAQLTTSYAMGGLSFNSDLTSYSGAIVFNGRSSCLSVSNGAATYYPTNNRTSLDKFEIACKQSGPKGVFELSAYPNPTSYNTVVMAKGEYNFNEKYSLDILDARGRLIQSYSGYLSAFQQGLVLPMHDLAGGTYFVNIRTEFSKKNFKVIKVSE